MTRRTSDVVIVGAGLVGSAIARRLAERGLAITIVEERRPAGGTSLATFAWVNAVGKAPRPYFDLNVAGIHEHRRLVGELGGGAWYHDGGNLEWSPRADELRAKIATYREWGYAVESIDRDQALKLEPHVDIGQEMSAAFYPDDAWVDPPLLVGRLLDHPRISIVAPATVERIATDGGRAAGVVLADGGGRISADRVVIAAGARTGDLTRAAGFSIPMQHAPGLLVVTEPAPTDVGRILHAPGIAIRPDGAGRLLLASDGIDKAIEPAGGETSVPAAIEELCRRAVQAVPRLAGVGVEAHRIGLRALTRDGKPAVGPLPGIDGVYVAVMHSGVTLGPLIGRLAGAEIADGAADPLLADYRPDRFAGANVAV